jgi:hypothetical protein
LRAWYDRLLAALADGMRRGSWSLVAVDGWPDNRSAERLAAWTWASAERRHLVAVNLSDEPADGRVRLPDVGPGAIVMTDVLSGERYDRDGATIAADGLYVALPPHGIHLLRF